MESSFTSVSFDRFLEVCNDSVLFSTLSLSLCLCVSFKPVSLSLRTLFWCLDWGRAISGNLAISNSFSISLLCSLCSLYSLLGVKSLYLRYPAPMIALVSALKLRLLQIFFTIKIIPKMQKIYSNKTIPIMNKIAICCTKRATGTPLDVSSPIIAR